MSKRKSKQTELQRFSGPDLSELLAEVANEFGSDAAIQAVNRVRSGGVGGFFCREEFEVIVNCSGGGTKTARSDISPSDNAPQESMTGANTATGDDTGAGADTPTGEDTATADQVESPHEVLVEPVVVEPAIADPSITVPLQPVAPTPPAQPDDEVSVSEELIDLDEHGEGQESADSEASSESDRGSGSNDIATEIFGGPRPEATNGTDAGFMALLERRLNETSETESPLTARRAQRSHPDEEQATVVPSPDTEPAIPAPGIAPAAEEASTDLQMLPTEPEMSSGFWYQLRQTQHELDSFMPVGASFVSIIGPLALITPIVHRLRSEPEFSSADIVVLTDRTEIVSEPQWRLVRSGHQLVDEAQRRVDRPTVLLIDVPIDLPNWVAPLQNRLRMAGVGLFRYAIPGNPTAETLEQYRLNSDVPYVLDLISRVAPDDLVDFVDRRHPIASVSGARLTTELLVAMRAQVGDGI